MNGRDTPFAGSKEAGTILLETLLVLPLYAVLLGGILWIGQLAYTRHTLLAADRLAAWSMGNRLAEKGVGETKSRLESERIFEAAREQQLSVAEGNGDLLADLIYWFKRNHAQASANQKVPVWAEGWLATNWQEGDADVEAPADHNDTEFDLKGRNETDDGIGGFVALLFGCPTEGHVVFSRTDGLVKFAREDVFMTFPLVNKPFLFMPDLFDKMVVPPLVWSRELTGSRNTGMPFPIFMPLELPED